MLGWGFPGLGGVAARMADALPGAQKAALVGVCSRDARKADDFGARYGAPGRYADYAAMLADDRVEAVYIATPNAHHAQHARAAIAAGKHVLVEKPMTLRLADAEALVAAAGAAHLVLGVGFHLRHHAVHQQIRQRIAAGDAGDLVFASAMWTSYGPTLHLQRERWLMQPEMAGAGSLMGVGVHGLNLLRWLVGDEVVEVSALNDGPSDLYPVEFLTSVNLRFANGVLGHLVSSRRLPNGRNGVTVYGTEARIEGDGTLSMQAEGTLRVTQGAETSIDQSPVPNPYARQLDAFAAAAVNGTPFSASGADGARVVALIDAILESARSGRSVRPAVPAV